MQVHGQPPPRVLGDRIMVELKLAWRVRQTAIAPAVGSGDFSSWVAGVRSGSIATKIDHLGHFRFIPKSGSTADIGGSPVRANGRHALGIWN